jgi:hypothetical protein
MNKLMLILTMLFATKMSAQDRPYYYEIPAAPEKYTASTVAARMVDGLGFRYFWASEGLRDQDLEFKPSEDGRTTGETLSHIEGLTRVLLNAVSRKTSEGPTDGVGFIELRALTLENIRMASEILKKEDADLEQFPIIFQRGDKTSEYPFWNMINGPIADALWHVGQVVSHRRSSGNPLPGGVSVLQGTKRD